MAGSIVLPRTGASGQAPDRAADAPPHDSAASRDGKPRSDWGTILLHWLAAAAMVASLITGLRIAADRTDATTARFIARFLPQGEVWTVHFIASITLFFAMSAYVVYVVLARLTARNAPGRTRAIALRGSGAAVRRARWSGVNVALHWLIYAVVATLTATGVALYLGYGGWVVLVHSALALATLAYLVLHTAAHFMYGGLAQLLRLFRPAPLPDATVRRRRPLLVAAAAASAVVVGVAWADIGGRSTLVVGKVAASPDLAKLLDDPAWRTARPVSVHTMQGANFGGTGETTVEIRALHDDDNIYFAFRWWDPTRSLRRVPMIKRPDGWHLVDADAAKADVVDYYEDKLAVIFSSSDAFGAAGATHLGPDPLPGSPKPLNERGYHYTDGENIDMWQWKAARGGLLGVMENMHIGPPTVPTVAERAVKGRYQAGYWGDPGDSNYKYNFPFEGPGGYHGAVIPPRLPKDWRATQAAMGNLSMDPETSVDAGSRWWMIERTETVPYSAEVDAAIPVGTMMPGVLITDGYTGERAGISVAADWTDEHWTLVAKRKLATGSKFDKDFIPGSKYYLWVSAFDHTQTRHTRHMRPVEVVMR